MNTRTTKPRRPRKARAAAEAVPQVIPPPPTGWQEQAKAWLERKTEAHPWVRLLWAHGKRMPVWTSESMHELMQAISIVLAFVALILMGIGLLPLLGLLNLLVMPLVVLGLVLGAFGNGRRPGLIMNIVVLTLVALRVVLGSGF